MGISSLGSSGEAAEVSSLREVTVVLSLIVATFCPSASCEGYVLGDWIRIGRHGVGQSRNQRAHISHIFVLNMSD